MDSNKKRAPRPRLEMVRPTPNIIELSRVNYLIYRDSLVEKCFFVIEIFSDKWVNFSGKRVFATKSVTEYFDDESFCS